MTRLFSPVMVLPLMLVAAGCGRGPAPTVAPESRATQPPPAETSGSTATQPEPAPPPRSSAPNRAILADMVFFDFDQSELRPEGRALMDSKLAVLQHSSTVRLRIAGHADERGSDEYNLALGMRRASAAARYLTQRGIAPSRLEAVSFGEEQPLQPGHDESAWSRNRRAEFQVTSGEVLP